MDIFWSGVSQKNAYSSSTNEKNLKLNNFSQKQQFEFVHFLRMLLNKN